MLNTIRPLTLVNLPVGPFIYPYALWLTIEIRPLENGTIGKYLNSSSMFKVCLPISFKYSSVVIKHYPLTVPFAVNIASKINRFPVFFNSQVCLSPHLQQRDATGLMWLILLKQFFELILRHGSIPLNIDNRLRDSFRAYTLKINGIILHYLFLQKNDIIVMMQQFTNKLIWLIFYMACKCGLKAELVCINEHCETNTNFVCSNIDCVVKHSHHFELNVIPISLLQKQLLEGERKDSPLMESIKRQRKDYLLEIKNQAISFCHEKQEQVNLSAIINKQCRGQILKALNQAQSGNWLDIDRKDLRSVMQFVTKQKKSDRAQKSFQRIKDSVHKKKMQRDDILQGIAKSKQLELLLQVSSLRSISLDLVKHIRAKDIHQGWNFSNGKIDALQITVSQFTKFIGFIHFPITALPSDNNIKLQVEVRKQKKTLMKKVFTFHKMKNQDIEIIFQKEIDLQPGCSYTIISTNIGSNFTGQYGNNSSEAGPFQLDESSLCTNGTSASSGQFKGFIQLK